MRFYASVSCLTNGIIHYIFLDLENIQIQIFMLAAILLLPTMLCSTLFFIIHTLMHEHDDSTICIYYLTNLNLSLYMTQPLAPDKKTFMQLDNNVSFWLVYLMTCKI